MTSRAVTDATPQGRKQLHGGLPPIPPKGEWAQPCRLRVFTGGLRICKRLELGMIFSLTDTQHSTLGGGVNISAELLAIICAISVLALFGVLYNGLFTHLQRHGYDEGYLALIVAGGVAVNLIVLALFDWRAALLSVALFTASGLPMAVGSFHRYAKRRAAAQHAMREETRGR